MATNPYAQFLEGGTDTGAAPSGSDNANPYAQFLDTPQQSPREQLLQAAVNSRANTEQARVELDQAKDAMIDTLKVANERNTRTIDAQNKANTKRQQLNANPVSPAANSQRQAGDDLATAAIQNTFNKFFGAGGSQRGAEIQELPQSQQDDSTLRKRTLAANILPSGLRQLGASDSTAGGFLAGAQQGATLGLLDEIQGGLAALEGGDYSQARDTAREVYAEQQRLNPTSTTVGEVAGAIPVAVGTGGAVSTAARAANLGRGATTAAQVAGAAVEGAVQGQGATEAELGTSQNVADTAIGGTIGAIFGLGGEVVGNLVRRLPKLRGNETAAKEELRSILREDIEVAREAENVARAERGEKPQTFNQAADAYIGDVDAVLTGVEQAARRPSIATGEDTLTGRATLADLPVFGDITTEANRIAQIDETTRGRLQQRGRDVVANVQEQLAPARRAGDVVGGVTLDDTAIANRTVRDTGRVGQAGRTGSTGQLDTTGFVELARSQAGERAGPIYEAAYRNNLSNASIDDINALLRNSPDFDGYLREGSQNARRQNLNRNIPSTPRAVQALEESRKLITGDLATAKQSGDVQGARGIRRVLSDLDRVLDRDAPNLRTARAEAATGFKAKDIQKGAAEYLVADDPTIINQYIKDVSTVDDNIIRELGGDRAAEQRANQIAQANASVGERARQLVTKRFDEGSRNEKGQLLTPRERENLNKLYAGEGGNNPVLDLLSQEEIVNRTANLAGIDRYGVVDRLKDSLPATFRDIASISSVAALANNPGAIAGTVAASRIGQSAAARGSRKGLAKELQKELFKYGATADDVKNILQGNFGKVPADVLAEVSTGLARSLGLTSTRENIEETN